MDQPGKVANPARGQLNRENNIPLSPCVPENLVSRDGFSRPVPRQPAHPHTQAESTSQGGKMSKRLGGIIGCKYKTSGLFDAPLHAGKSVLSL